MAQMKVCEACGSRIAEDAAGCPSCGATIAQNTFATRTVASTSGSPPSTRSRLSPSRPGSATGARFGPGSMLAGRYQIVTLLGKGGMGEVYRAEDLTLGQSVALKFLPEALAYNEDALRRFRNEVRLARQVSHPNVCRVHDVGEADGQIFLTMEYVDGEDLASLLRRIGRLPQEKALEIARKLCAGLAAAHDKGVLHRDLKPANVMLDARGQVLLTDFGLAGLPEEPGGAEVRSGTPAYMAPEQLAGKEVTVRSDIYSLGLVLYELFTGKRPFEGNSLAELMDARAQNTPASLSTQVSDLDPAIERVVLRCLDPDPQRRPASALLVSAGLPGGDPLAAALAAGETPTPQMVAAAGEGAGLAVKYAAPLFALIVIGVSAHLALAHRGSALEQVAPPYSPEVLRHKAREVIQHAGYTERPADQEHGIAWDNNLIAHVSRHDKPAPKWSDVLTSRPPVLRYWYRESLGMMRPWTFHDDLLTPAVLRPDDPPPVTGGMKHLELDPHGRLLEFRSMPLPLEEQTPASAEPDWTPLFAAAEIDPRTLTETAPQWRFLEASDLRKAWTGTWPGSNRPLRVEAAALQGRPVVFRLTGSWTKPERMPDNSATPGRIYLLIFLGMVFVVGAPLVARANLRRGRGDRRGALRLAAFICGVHLALWITRGHFAPTAGVFGDFFFALATSVFYGVVIWTVYIAVEPSVRRHWPHAIISSTRVLSGRVRDPIVGRDALIGCGFAVSWIFVEHGIRAFGTDAPPDFVSGEMLIGLRGALGEVLETVPHAIRETLLFFFLVFLLRVFLRNQWLAAAAFAAILTWLAGLGNASPANFVANGIIYSSIGFMLLRYGLLALASAIFFVGLIGDLPVTANASAWYLQISLVLMLTAFAILVWAFRESVRGQNLAPADLFG